VTGEHISILAQLPSLTELTAPIVAAAAPQLPLLTQLKKLDFFSGYEQTSDPFLPFIPRLHQLTELSLSQCSLSDEQGVRIMSGCKQLISFALVFVRVESLAWLSSVEGSCSAFNEFKLWRCHCDSIQAIRCEINTFSQVITKVDFVFNLPSGRFCHPRSDSTLDSPTQLNCVRL